MTLHTLKLLAIPCVIAAFVTTGAGVMAYQGGTASGPAQTKAQPTAEKASVKVQTPAKPASTGLTERQIDQEFEGYLFRLASGDPSSNTVSAAITFSFNQRHVNANLGTTPDRAGDARKGHLDRMERLVQAIKESKLDADSKAKSLARARFAVTEAAKAVDPTRNPFGPEPAGGGMGGGTGGGGGAFEGVDHETIEMRKLTRKVAKLDRSPKSKEIWKKLDEPIAMSFAQETPLSDVLKYIQSATTGKTDSGIPIYVDPIALQETEKTIDSPVALNLEGVPLKTTLRLALKQLGLAYCVIDGLLYIGTEEGVMQELSEAESELSETPHREGGMQ